VTRIVVFLYPDKRRTIRFAMGRRRCVARLAGQTGRVAQRRENDLSRPHPMPAANVLGLSTELL